MSLEVTDRETNNDRKKGGILTDTQMDTLIGGQTAS
jgi:hypothetical protein